MALKRTIFQGASVEWEKRYKLPGCPGGVDPKASATPYFKASTYSLSLAGLTFGITFALAFIFSITIPYSVDTGIILFSEAVTLEKLTVSPRCEAGSSSWEDSTSGCTPGCSTEVITLGTVLLTPKTLSIL